MFIFFIENLEVPFFEECSFGYYEWFAKRVENTITITKIPILAPFKKVISDYDYDLEIEYLPELKDKDKFLRRNETYELVENYWDGHNHLNYMKIKIEKKKENTILIPYTQEEYKLELDKTLEKLKCKLKSKRNTTDNAKKHYQ